jgi:hypothetical protein
VRFLGSLPLDPDELDRPVPEPGPHDVVLCGCPRTGTTLLCAALFQPPEVISVMEPWDGMRLAPAQLFASLRQEIDRTATLRSGRLDLEDLRATGATNWCAEGKPFDVDTEPDYVLAVKWPGYWRYLDVLPTTRFVVTLRDPVGTIASFKQQGGRVGLGLQYQTSFNRDLNAELKAATDDPALRRVLLFDYVHQRLLGHLERPNVHVVRYERWFVEPAAVLAELGSFLGRPLDHSPVTLRRPGSARSLDDRDRALIRKRCTTAEALGYDLRTLTETHGP